MLMNFSSKYNGTRQASEGLSQRRGHKVVRINNSIFVVGGAEKCGKSINRVHRINCSNNRIDSLILDNTLELQGFSMFPYEETIFIWGGQHLSQYSNQLLQFNGTLFTSLKQYGVIPNPRSNHSSTTFAAKYFIIYGGNDDSKFFKDWNMLNLKTGQWMTLKASYPVGFCVSSSMVWLNGRGILMTNNECIESQDKFRLNNFYQFYVSDFKKGLLKVIPIQISHSNIFNQYVFTSLSILDTNCILLIADSDYSNKKSSQQRLNPSYIIHLEQQVKVQRFKLRLKQRKSFQTICYMNKLFIIGGYNQIDHNTLDIYHIFMDKQYKRNVCAGCKLYFDQQWVHNSKEVFTHAIIKEDYDYNYFLKIDNRVLHKLSQYITHQIYAVSLIIQQVLTMSPKNIKIQRHTDKSTSQNIPQEFHYLKMSFMLQSFRPKCFLQHFLLIEESQKFNGDDIWTQNEEQQINNVIDFQLMIIQMKMAIFRLGKSCILSVKIRNQEAYIIYFSYDQLDCTNNIFLPFSNFHYYYNSRTGQTNSPLSRHIITQNVQGYVDQKQYEQLEDRSFSLTILCKEDLLEQFHIASYYPDPLTGESQIVNSMKQENRSVNLLQFTFLNIDKMPQIYIQNSRLTFIRIMNVLEGDHNSKILQKNYKKNPNPSLFDNIMLYHYPSEYWFRKILIYHNDRLIIDFNKNKLQICGIIKLQTSVKLDLSGNRLLQLQDEQKLKQFINSLSLGKRSKVHTI